jgi:hypothetical protein
MKPEAQQALDEIRSFKRMDDYIRCARAELASDPENLQLSTFIALMQRLLAQEQARLCGICADPNSEHVHAGLEQTLASSNIQVQITTRAIEHMILAPDYQAVALGARPA